MVEAFFPFLALAGAEVVVVVVVVTGTGLPGSCSTALETDAPSMSK